MNQDIYSFITQEESVFRTRKVPIRENYEWSMYDHITTTILYLNSKYKNSQDEPFKNIIRPILSLQHRATGFDVKDIVIYINDITKHFKSFLVRKFHEVWARKNHIDTFIDELIASYVDFGGVLIKDLNENRPEVVPLERLAFCDQTDMLSGPICEKHFYSPDQLKEMEKNNWGNDKYGATETIDNLLVKARTSKNQPSQKQATTPGKYIEIYELHGMFPKWWMSNENFSGEEDDPENEYTRQFHIIAFYQSEKKEKKGITLFRSNEKKLSYKFQKRYPSFAYGRALGIGGAEELFESQVWLNYSLIREKAMLDVGSKVIHQTADKRFANRNKTTEMDNGEILIHEEGKPLTQINTSPINYALFERSINDWENHARQMGSANESILGEQPASGTPFKLQELITNQSQSYHEEHKGVLAIFLDEIYQDWIIPKIAKEINSGQKFLAELDLEELQTIAEQLIVNEVNKAVVEKILSGQLIYPDEIDVYKEIIRERFMKGGNKKFIELLKDEFKDAPFSVKINIVGKQEYLSKLTDKLVNVFRQIFSAPQMLDDPRMAKLFNQILESSGLNPIDFQTSMRPQMAQPVKSTEPLKELALANKGQ